MAMFSGEFAARWLARGYAVETVTLPYDGVSAVPVGEDGMCRFLLPVPPGAHRVALAVEVGGRAWNLLRRGEMNFPEVLCAHGLVDCCDLRPVPDAMPKDGESR